MYEHKCEGHSCFECPRGNTGRIIASISCFCHPGINKSQNPKDGGLVGNYKH
ncbi:MAG: hypothetical protein M0R30_12265 [Methanoregula sp.]|uniref:hypothetical protein n=1 Tax=Methanoregula sp. TaxID=2052170 RepID=UPI0025EA933B|nr:hypothetical protein [Methanoregula sp.]MCK9632398.1 hypothetical protein [Methanoregula sp.]